MHNYTLTNFHQIKELKKIQTYYLKSTLKKKKKLYSSFSIIGAKLCKLNTRLVNSIGYLLCFGL